MNMFAVRAAQLAEDRSELFAVDPLLKAREAVEQQILELDRKVLRLARNNARHARRHDGSWHRPSRTALCFLATIDNPAHFEDRESVGAYAGLTTRRYASGEIDWTGRISKCGDKMLRSYLYEAANVLLTRVAKWSVLKAWASACSLKRSGLRKAKVAVLRKLAHSAPNVDRRYRINWSSGKGGC